MPEILLLSTMFVERKKVSCLQLNLCAATGGLSGTSRRAPAQFRERWLQQVRCNGHGWKYDAAISAGDRPEADRRSRWGRQMGRWVPARWRRRDTRGLRDTLTRSPTLTPGTPEGC